jgi:hypothetical protein
MAFVAKAYRTDPAYRPRLRRLVWLWITDELRMVRQSLRGRHPLPVSMILAELRGGLRGLLGEYERSLRRTEQIRRRHP